MADGTLRHMVGLEEWGEVGAEDTRPHSWTALLGGMYTVRFPSSIVDVSIMT